MGVGGSPAEPLRHASRWRETAARRFQEASQASALIGRLPFWWSSRLSGLSRTKGEGSVVFNPTFGVELVWKTMLVSLRIRRSGQRTRGLGGCATVLAGRRTLHRAIIEGNAKASALHQPRDPG